MESLLLIALKHLDRAEGGYVNNPNDRGGETYRGIARNKNPDWKGWDIIDAWRDHAEFPKILDNMTSLQMLVDDLYRTRYWVPCRCDDMPAEMAVLMFDAAVHHSPRRATMILQQTLHVKMDGVIGDITLAALNRFVQKHGIPEAMVNILGYRAEFIHAIVVADTSQAEFLRGWLNRLFRLQQFALGI